MIVIASFPTDASKRSGSRTSARVAIDTRAHTDPIEEDNAQLLVNLFREQEIHLSLNYMQQLDEDAQLAYALDQARIPCHHENILQEPHVSHLVTYLKHCLT